MKKHWWIWVLALLLLGGGGSVGGLNLGGLLSGSTGLLVIIGLIWYFSKHRHAA